MLLFRFLPPYAPNISHVSSLPYFVSAFPVPLSSLCSRSSFISLLYFIVSLLLSRFLPPYAPNLPHDSSLPCFVSLFQCLYSPYAQILLSFPFFISFSPCFSHASFLRMLLIFFTSLLFRVLCFSSAPFLLMAKILLSLSS